MNHTDVSTALDRLRREVTILLEMQDKGTPYDTDESRAIQNRLILAQSKKVRSSSNLLVRAIARERDELLEDKRGSHAFREMVRNTDPSKLQP